MRLTSSAFANGDVVPVRYTCDGLDVSPPLTIDDIPASAASLVVLMDDPDAPAGTWVHWLAYDVPVVREIPEAVASLGISGCNSWGKATFGGPCPPRGSHRYFIRVYALDTTLGLGPGADRIGVLDALAGHVLAEATLMGTYSRP